jgi:tetratricopeptide (TPR) repeat protein
MLLGIMFIVATLSYAYSIYRQSKNIKELLDIVDNFSSNKTVLDTKNLAYDSSMKKPLFLLATAYKKSGEYAKSIDLYLYLLEHSKDEALLSHLADAYLLAGFYKKSQDIYLRILHKKPRDIKALYRLEFIYEKLGDIASAKDALDVLANLDQSVEMLQLHLDIAKILKEPKSPKQKFDALVAIKSQNSWPILRELFKLDPKRAFRYYKDSDFEYLIDTLYNLKEDSLDLDVVNSYDNLTTLYYTKGYTKSAKSSSSYKLNILAKAKSCGANNARLEFIYICQKCKNRYPLFISRCPNCHRAYKTKIEVTIAKEVKRGQTLQ